MLNLDILDKEFESYELGILTQIQTAHDDSKFCPTISIVKGKGIVIPDLHIPYFKGYLLKKVIEEAKDYRDFCVIAGDVLDQKCMSKFPKDTETLLEDEYRVGLEVLNIIKERFNHVYVIMGNHDARTKSALMRDSKFLKLSFLCIPDPLFYLTKGIAFDDGIPTQKYDFSNVSYFGSRDMQIGDVIFCHPNNYSRANGKTVETAIEYYLDHKKTFNAAIIGHTHNAIKITHLGKVGYEIGCLCYDLLPPGENIRSRQPINAYLKLSYNKGCYVPSETALIELE